MFSLLSQMSIIPNKNEIVRHTGIIKIYILILRNYRAQRLCQKLHSYLPQLFNITTKEPSNT